MKRRSLLAAVPAVTLWSRGTHAQAPVGPAGVPLIPIATMFRRAAYANVTLSPDGQSIAATIPLNDRQNLAVLDLKQRAPVLLTRFTRGDVNSITWATNNRLLYTTGDQQGLEFRGDGGLFAVDRDGANPRTLVEPVLVNDKVKFVYRFTRVLRRIKGSNDEVLVTANDRSEDSQDIYRMNIDSGRKALLSFDSPGFVASWVVDSQLKPRAAISIDMRRKRWWSSVRSPDDKGWITIAEWDEKLQGVIIPRAFDPVDPSVLYVNANVGRDTLAFFKFDTKTMKLGEMVAGTARYDLGSFWLIGGPLGESGQLLFNGVEEDGPAQLVGLRANLDRPTTVWFDDEGARQQRTVDAALPGAVNTFDPYKTRSLVRSSSPTNPGAFYWYDRDKRQLEDSGLRVRPGLDPAWLAPMQYVTWTARDGMKIGGYLTLPRNFKAGSPVPFVLHPHGGPWAKDNWGFDREVQFMANRGYAVLQPNFRGSTGYGAKHLRASYKQWGGAMIDDMLDGVQWAIDQGYADKDRMGVYGASYGGYSALMAMVKRPDWFKWGINYVGVTDMTVHQDTQPAQLYWDFAELAKAINGDQSLDRAMFEATSPTRQLARINAPVFHVYGGLDRNVDIANGNAIKSAFDKAGKPYEWMFVADEHHGFYQDKNVIEFYTRFERFMLAHTPPAR